STRDAIGGVNRVTSGASGVVTAANAGEAGIGCPGALGGSWRRKAGDVGASIQGSVVDLVTDSRIGPVRGSVRSVRAVPPDLRAPFDAAAGEAGANASVGCWVLPLMRPRGVASGGLSSTVGE